MEDRMCTVVQEWKNTEIVLIMKKFGIVTS